jgi:hypothetical protein
MDGERRKNIKESPRTPLSVSSLFFFLSLSHTFHSGYALPKPLALAAVARWGLGPVSAVSLAAGVALGGLWLCGELAALEALPPGAWRVKGGGGGGGEGRRRVSSGRRR